MDAQLPLLGFDKADAPLLRTAESVITREQFVRTTMALAKQIPSTKYAINLCQDRYFFLLGFAAACLREQTNLLPASQAAGALQVLKLEYPDHYVIDDDSIARQVSTLPSQLPDNADTMPRIARNHLAAICFTSGSTGKPQAHHNSWGTLVASAQRSAAGIFGQSGLNLVATVPPQHMFGLETTVFQPMVNNCAIHTGKPFFPGDVCAALQSVPAPRALITTPTHLRACVASLASMPALEFVLSATAPMPAELAAQTEAQWQTKVLEIYGSTETGAIATRQTTQGETWSLLPGGSLLQDKGVTQFLPKDAEQAILLHDDLQRRDATHFLLAGRNNDLIKIGGKRASLAELNARLLAIPGVIDGVMFQPSADQRTAALVVAHAVSKHEILAALSIHLDEVFLPRPLRIVSALPRDALGKLPRAQLLAALEQARD